MDDLFIGFTVDNTVLGIALLIIAGIVVAVCGTWRWSILKPALFTESDYLKEKPTVSSVSDAGGRWLDDLPSILAGARYALEREATAEARAPIDLMRNLDAETAGFISAVKTVLQKSLKSAGLHSLLVKCQDSFAYVVVVPSRHEHPHLIKRYPAFSSGWVSHATAMRAALMSRGEFSRMIGLLFFLSPDARNGLLLVSYADADTALFPSVLIHESEIKGMNAKTINSFFEFKMSN